MNKENEALNIKSFHKQYYIENRERLLSVAKKNYSIKTKSKSRTKIKNFAKDSLKIKFPYGQYWLIEYYEKKTNGLDFKFKTFIFSRSADFAKVILLRKTKEDDPSSKIKILKIAMLHKDFRLRRKKITTSNWLDVRNCCFPNELNILFKHHDS